MGKVVGFTGTQLDMTEEQQVAVGDLLHGLDPSQAHHGDCIGADATFHKICKSLGIFTVGHPGMDRAGNSPKRAYCDVKELREVLPYSDRNSMIVEECDILIATPKGFEEEKRSGTWMTVRRARRSDKTIFIVYPDGKIGTI